MTAETDIQKLSVDLSSNDWYTKKHALWTLARHVQLHGGSELVQYDILGVLADGISDPDDTIRARSIWLVGLLAESGEGGKFRALGDGQIVITALENALEDTTKASICKPNSGELEWTTVGELARVTLDNLN